MLHIVVLDAKTLGSDIDLTLFECFGKVDVYAATQREEIWERIKQADIIITNKVIIDQEVLDFAANLKLICLTATGTNNVDLGYAKQKNIAVTNVAGYSTKSVAQHTFAMLFYLLEHLRYYDEYVKNGDYQKSDIFTHLDRPFYEVYGKKWGIIGLGAIGREVAKIAEAFGANVVYYSTSGANYNSEYTRVELEELLSTCDIISIHAPLNEKTKGLIGEIELRKMQPHSILINVGRGGIVEEEALAKALDEDWIGGAALDVLSQEPIRTGHTLLTIKNTNKLYITPHIAWASVEARKTLIEEITLNIEAFLRNEKRNRVES